VTSLHVGVNEVEEVMVDMVNKPMLFTSFGLGSSSTPFSTRRKAVLAGQLNASVTLGRNELSCRWKAEQNEHHSTINMYATAYRHQTV
jgi:hypothetical protein